MSDMARALSGVLAERYRVERELGVAQLSVRRAARPVPYPTVPTRD